MVSESKTQDMEDDLMFEDDDRDRGAGAGAGASSDRAGSGFTAFDAMMKKRPSSAAILEGPKAAKQSKQSSPEVLAQRRWNARIKHLPYIKNDEAAEKRYVNECASSDGVIGNITCLWCLVDESKPERGGTNIQVGKTTGNIALHEGTQQHKRVAATHVAIAASEHRANWSDHVKRSARRSSSESTVRPSRPSSGPRWPR